MWKPFSEPTQPIPASRFDTLFSNIEKNQVNVSTRVAAAKSAYSTRRANLARVSRLLTGELSPHAGDLVLARVTELGQHGKLELRSGRRACMHVGDEIVICYGARYAPHQFEAYVPDSLELCHLVAAGGIAARCVNKHHQVKRPTTITPIGILADESGRRLNLADSGLPQRVPEAKNAIVIAVLGTSMNAGKTTTAAALVRGLRSQGRHVAACKVTGTGAGGDRWVLQDSGAVEVLDFTDAGVPSTFGLQPDKIQSIFLTLVAELQALAVDTIIVEVADGLCHAETAALINSPAFRQNVDGVMFAAGDALGADAGMKRLEDLGLNVLGCSGVVTMSPLAIRETESLTDLPVVTIKELGSGSGIPAIAARRRTVVPCTAAA